MHFRRGGAGENPAAAGLLVIVAGQEKAALELWRVLVYLKKTR